MDFIYFFLLSFDNDIYKILGYVFSTFWHRFKFQNSERDQLDWLIDFKI